MLNAFAPHLDNAAGRVIGGILILSADHPFALMLILAGLAGASAAVLFDAVACRP